MKTKTYTEASSSCWQLRCRGAWQRMSLALLLLMLTTMTAWAADVSLQQDGSEWYVNMPQTGSNTLTLTDASVTTFKVYDYGGKNGDYSSNYTGYLVLSAPAGYIFQLSGNIMTETNWDKLTVYNGVYDGTDNNIPKLLDGVSSTNKGVTTAIGPVISSGNNMTIYFHSDGSTNYAGLDLTVTVVDPNAAYVINGLGTVMGGSIAASVGGANATTAKMNDVVTLTATPDTDNDYIFNGFSVTYANTNAVAVTWDGWFDNTATFTMPGSEVTVTPTFIKDPGNLSVNMPKTGNKSITIPLGVHSFNVYDDGGKDGDYSRNCDGTLVLTAPDGYKLQLSGSIKTETSYWGTELTVYNGSKESGTTLLNKVSSPTAGETLAIGPVISTGNVMTIYFKSGTYTQAGLDLIVTVVNPNASYAINGLGSVTGGSIAASVGGVSATTAKLNDIVTLTATPESGYIFSGVSVTDANSNAVAATGEWYSDNKATFTMPGSAVTVTPTFTNVLTNLSVNMPTTGEKDVIIPSGVQSFKVYDDGGVSGDYSQNCDGTLVLTAPAGYVLQLSGNITTQSSYWGENLTVYNGADNTATTLINEVSSPTAGETLAIGPVISTGNVMTVYFHTGASYTEAGLDLTVALISVLSETTGITDAESLKGRTAQFSRTFSAGVASTLCLPFPMTTIPGGKAYEFTDVSYDATANSGAGAWVATMTEVSATVANTPYLYKADANANVVFRGTVASDFNGNAGTSTSGDWTFKGTYSRLTYGTEPFEGNVYGFASTSKTVEGVAVAAGEFVMAASGASVPPMRCYLTYKGGEEYTAARGLTRGAAIQIPDRITVRLVGKDGDINGIGTLTLSTGEFTTEGWYSLNGRKLDGKPTKKGLYINNGRKVVIK